MVTVLEKNQSRPAAEPWRAEAAAFTVLPEISSVKQKGLGKRERRIVCQPFQVKLAYEHDARLWGGITFSKTELFSWISTVSLVSERADLAKQQHIPAAWLYKVSFFPIDLQMSHFGVIPPPCALLDERRKGIADLGFRKTVVLKGRNSKRTMRK